MWVFGEDSNPKWNGSPKMYIEEVRNRKVWELCFSQEELDRRLHEAAMDI